MSFIAMLLTQHLAVFDSHFRRSMLFQTIRNEYRQALSTLNDNQSTSFKGRSAQQAEHREAMTKQEGSRQIKLAWI